MKYEIEPNCCRVCLRKNKKLRSIYKPLEEGDEVPSKMLEVILGFSLETDEQLPQQICKACELSLSLAYQFRQQALRSQRIIEKYSNTMHLEDDDERVNPIEINVKEEIDSHSMGMAEMLMKAEFETEKLTLIESNKIKVESLELPYPEEDGGERVEYLDVSFLDWEGLEENGLAADGAELQTSSEDELPALHQTTESQLSTTATVTLSTPSEDEDDEEDGSDSTDSPAKSAATGSALSAKRTYKPKKKNDDKSGHICDVCGNIYPKRGRMMEHRRRHNKELRFACELCDQRFHLRENLRKHMYSHTGGKPYKCNYCSRTFFYKSVKNAHEAIHQGHKPYVCQVCNKAFAYSHALKKHKLIHAEIKLYHCVYCDKDFRLQHHMKQHIETKMHQNAVRSAEMAIASTGGGGGGGGSGDCLSE